VAHISAWNVRAGAFVEGVVIFLAVSPIWVAAFLKYRRRARASVLAVESGARVQLPPVEIAPSPEIPPFGDEVPPPSQAPVKSGG
jgi:hypothetical protein